MTTMPPQQSFASPPPPLPMPTPAPRAPRGSRLPAFLGYWFAFSIMMLMPVGLFVYAVGVWVPQVKPVYRDFKTTLPRLTEWLVAQADSVSSVPFWVEVILAVGLLSLVLAAVTALMPRGFLRASIAMVSMLIVLGLTVAETVVLYNGIWDPFLKLIRSIGP